MSTAETHPPIINEADPAGEIQRRFTLITNEAPTAAVATPKTVERDYLPTDLIEQDPVGPQGIEDASRIAYEVSRQRITAAIAKTREDKDTEAVRQAAFFGAGGPDDKADKRSEKAFADVNALRRPAGAKKLGGDTLHIIGS